MGQIIFTVNDGRSITGYRHVAKDFDDFEMAKDYMHKYHNRATGWFTWIEDGKAYRHYDKVGVL